MKRAAQLLAAISLITILSACSTPSSDEQNASTQAIANNVTNTPDVIATPTDQAAGTSNNVPQPTAAEEPKASEPVVPAKLYRMTDAYRFKPLQDGTTDKVVLLTFDDGPKDESVLTSMLDILDEHKAKAIFFVNGYRVKQNPELLKLIHERGQTIGNHSWDHIDLKEEQEAVIKQQIESVQTEVEALIGEKPLFFRPPYGSGGEQVKEIVKNHGMLYMTWSNGSLDWDQSAKDKPDVVISNVMEQLHPGANILMHELEWTADALNELLTKLEKEGYGFIDPASIQITR